MAISDTFAISPRSGAGLVRYLAAGVVLLLLVTWYRISPYRPPRVTYQKHERPQQEKFTPAGYYLHPIDKLIEDAQGTYNDFLANETTNLADAAAAYRRRRGRHPPPGFHMWHEFAMDRDALMVEDFFDMIYHDLAPFWGILPEQLRREAKHNEKVISVRNGKATANDDVFWAGIWLDLIKTIEAYLPDLDIALNSMDEPRLIVPWETINAYMMKEQQSRNMPEPSKMKQAYGGRAKLDSEEHEIMNTEWERNHPYFEKAKRACPPDSLSRLADVEREFDHDAIVTVDNAIPHSYQGYVSNYTKLSDICHQPDLQSLHGAFIEPESLRASDHLFPLFGGSKLSVNNEILLPPPMYWESNERFGGGSDHGNPWSMKNSTVVWRGFATGGRNRAQNWKGFQRHRFISMVNGTQVKRAEDGIEAPLNYGLPPDFYKIKAAKDHHLGDWLTTFMDAGFVSLRCFPHPGNGTCSYTADHYELLPEMTMPEQYRCKYLPDLDGNSFSGRFWGFLQSNSLPIKATIFREWHDSRLIPWKHFVPMDNRYLDFYGIMEYFLGFSLSEDPKQVVEGHDAVAEAIALAGQEWASKVLRKEDMQIYVFRLLLEFARVTDDNRERLGYVADIK